MKHISRMTQAEVAAFVQGHLLKKGIEVVLSGGASVAIYSSDMYVSKDVDLVDIYSSKPSAIKTAMEEIGFHEEGRYFRHPNSEVIVEFPPGPLAVGAEPIKTIIEIKFPNGDTESHLPDRLRQGQVGRLLSLERPPSAVPGHDGRTAA